MIKNSYSEPKSEDNNPKMNEYSNWCKEMSEKSSDGKEAYNYYQLQQFWLDRGL